MWTDAGQPVVDAGQRFDAGVATSGWEFRIRTPGEKSGHFAQNQIRFRGTIVSPSDHDSFADIYHHLVPWIVDHLVPISGLREMASF